jgi:hypothetical protein
MTGAPEKPQMIELRIMMSIEEARGIESALAFADNVRLVNLHEAVRAIIAAADKKTKRRSRSAARTP